MDPLRKILAELLAELKQNPGDERLTQKIAETFQKLGENAKAADYFVLVALSHHRDGFFLKEVAVLKQCLKLRPDWFEVHERLAATCLQLGLNSDAVLHLGVMADALARLGDTAGVLRLHDQIRELDSTWCPAVLH